MIVRRRTLPADSRNFVRTDCAEVMAATGLSLSHEIHQSELEFINA